jgi:hypothetical protein
MGFCLFFLWLCGCVCGGFKKKPPKKEPKKNHHRTHKKKPQQRPHKLYIVAQITEDVFHGILVLFGVILVFALLSKLVNSGGSGHGDHGHSHGGGGAHGDNPTAMAVYVGTKVLMFITFFNVFWPYLMCAVCVGGCERGLEAD